MVTSEKASLDGEFAQLAKASLDLQEPESVFASILSLGHSSDLPKKDAFEIASSLARVERTVSSLGFFSRNETEDDVATNKLKYLLLPYLEAVALLGCQGKTEERLSRVTRARALLEQFLNHINDLGLVKGVDRKLLASDGGDVEGMTPGDRRQAKIARYKKDKEAKGKLVQMYARLKMYGDEGEEEDEYEEQRRDAMKVLIESACCTSLDMLAECEQEAKILEYAAEYQRQGKEPPRPVPRKPEGIGGLPANFVIMDRRQQIRNQVFQPSHSLPTYTVEEWGEIEARRAKELTERQRRAEAARESEGLNEDDDVNDEVADKETYKAREWDDWKDEHNKGSGNTLR